MALGARVLAALLLAGSGCTTTRGAGVPPPARAGGGTSELDPAPLAPLGESEIHVEPEPLTVESSWILDLYTLLHARDYRVLRVSFPGSDGAPAVAHLALPPGPGPHPAVIAFPILAGSHVVSEGLSKGLVRRGYVVLRLERRPLGLETASDPGPPMAALRHAVADARRLLPWLMALPEVDEARLAAAGVSLGGILAASLMGADDRIQAGFFLMAGGGLPEILWDSEERPVRAFREQLRARYELETREDFTAFLAPHTRAVDPLSYASGLESKRILLVSGRFDRVILPDATEALWRAAGQPTWIRLPVGHYQMLPFFWWAIARGADHLDRVLGPTDAELAQR